jgi:hypothetical protein
MLTQRIACLNLFPFSCNNALILSVHQGILMRCAFVTLLQQSLGSSSSSSHQPRWRHCATPRRIPFEPAIDRESGALFLGGGVGIAAAPKGVLCRKRQTMATPVQRMNTLIERVNRIYFNEDRRMYSFEFER